MHRIPGGGRPFPRPLPPLRIRSNRLLESAIAAGGLEAERNFRKVVGYRSLPKLDGALRAHDAAIDRRVDHRKQAA